MAYKPIPEKTYLQYLKLIQWTLKKSGIDWSLRDENGKFLCNIIISHAKGRKREVVPYSAKQTERLCKERGIKWPPIKK